MRIIDYKICTSKIVIISLHNYNYVRPIKNEGNTQGHNDKDSSREAMFPCIYLLYSFFSTTKGLVIKQ